jgi:hypothetical protein
MLQGLRDEKQPKSLLFFDNSRPVMVGVVDHHSAP